MTQPFKPHYPPLETDWSRDAIVGKSRRFTSPSTHTFQAYAQPLLLKQGDGAYLWDAAGRRYVDLEAQNLCIRVGYTHPLVNSEGKRQMDLLTHCTAKFLSAAAAHYAEELAGRFPSGHEWVVQLVNSGGEAVDLALTMARVFTGHADLIALKTAYHGIQGAAMAATGIHLFRQPVPPAARVLHVANPHSYRDELRETAEDYLAEIDAAIASATPGKVAGMIVEPVQGFGGVIPLPDGYLAGAFERIRAAGGVGIVDEIQTGFTRTGEHFWGFEADGVLPDIVVLGKGIGNGFPLSAVVARKEIAAAIAEKIWFSTYGSNPMSATAGRAVLRAIDEDRTLQRAREIGGRFKTKLQALQAKYDLIGDVRGTGFLLGVELVSDRRTKQPADTEAGRIAEHARENGVIVGKGGELGNVLRINPPFCIQDDDVDLCIEVLDQAFREV